MMISIEEKEGRQKNGVKIYKLGLILAIMAFLMTGCSNVQDANEKNFKTAVQTFLDTAYPQPYFLVNFPYRSDTFSFNNISNVLQVLAKLGIVTETEISRKNIPESFGSEAREEIVYSYELTDEGKKFYKADAAKNLRGENLGGFCFGKAKVARVVNFTAPTDFLGYKVSHVTYAYTVSDLPKWAKNSELWPLNDQLKNDVQSEKEPVEKTDAFILTDKGWIHEQLMK